MVTGIITPKKKLGIKKIRSKKIIKGGVEMKKNDEISGIGKDLYVVREIIYIHDEDDIEIIDEFSGNMGLTIDQALDLVGVDMVKYADSKGWDGYDWDSLAIRDKEE